MILGWAAMAAVLLAAVFFRNSGEGAARSLAASDDGRILATVPAMSREARAERSLLRGDPRDLATALRVARVNIEEARARSDPRYLGRAEGVLSPWWNAPEPPHEVLVLRATIRQSNHDFDGALGDLSQALAQVPDDPQALLVQSSLLLLRGDYERARQSCERLRPHVESLVLATCSAAIDGMTGRAQAGYDALAALAPSASTDPAVSSWALTVLAELAVRLGDSRAADAWFAAALAIAPDDGYLLGARADHLLDTGRAREVLPLLAGRSAADGLLLRLALAEKAIGHPDAARHADELGARLQASRARGDSIHLREEARHRLFLAEDPAPALALALENWKVQREPIDARLVLEAAIAAGDNSGAAPVLEWMRQTGYEDPLARKLAQRLEGA